MSRCIYKSEPRMADARKRVDVPREIREDLKISKLVKDWGEGRKYFIKTFGCQANIRDEEIMAGYLEKAGLKKAGNGSEADIVIINTCAVRENAEDKVYGEIGKFKAQAYKNKNFILAVCGCMMQEEGFARYVMKTYPFVNIIFGTHNVHNLLSLIDEHFRKNKDLVDVISFTGDIVENLPSSRLNNSKAFVNITYGCDKFCTYCIVPYTRGRERSRKEEDILEECRQLYKEGYKEVTLLGQNVNSYGKDFHDGTSFASILEKVAQIGFPRVRYLTSHPWDFTDEMIDVMAKYPNIMKWLHLPVQSGNSEVLKRMGRRYTREEYLDLVKRIRAKIPNIALTTDIIVGFPNETEEEFEDTLTLAKEVKYFSAFTFIYSPRKGTPAAAIKDNVSDEDKHNRFNRLVEVIEAGVSDYAKEMVGKVYEVLVEGESKKDSKILSGYTESNKLINFEGPKELKGELVRVLVDESHTYSLHGVLLDDPVIVLANKIAKSLQNEDISIEFNEAKQALEANNELKGLRNLLAETQVKLTKARVALDKLETGKLEKEYEDLKAKYYGHPLVANYQNASEKMFELLSQIRDELK